MIGLLALAVVTAQPVEAAERAFASMAQTKGQWTAFRAFAALDAVMILDGPQPAAPFLKGRADPSVAVMWWPARTVTSCDGRLAFSTGPWRRRGGLATGRFFTIWQKQADGGWKWVFDGGIEDDKATPASDKVDARRAACVMPAGDARALTGGGGGASPDGSLRWSLAPDATGRGRRLIVSYASADGWANAADVSVG